MSGSIFKELEKGSLPGLKRCISLYPSSVNLKNPAGASPLHVAAGLGQAALVKELLVHGAQHDSTDGDGNIPLHLASGQGSVETAVELLAGRKLTAKTKNRAGQTPLHLAVIGGHKAVVEKLLDAGVLSTAKDKAGNTPLSLADPNDEEMVQLLQGARQASTSTSSLGTSSSTRGMELTPGGQRSPATSGMLPAGGISGRLTLPLASASVSGGGAAAGTPVTPTPRSNIAATPAGSRTPPPASHANPQGTRTPPPAPVIGIGGAVTNRLPRSAGGASASPATSAGGAHSVGGAAPGTAAQLQKYDVAIQSLKEGLRAATERLGALDACTAAQLECAGQVEKALGACGNNSRAVLDLETRVAFQEERGRDTRTRLERLEETERERQDSIKRLADDHRSLTSQLHRVADQVASSGGAAGQRLASAGDSSSHSQALQAEVAVLRAQLDQIAPALALATSASAEVRTLAARLDVLQQQPQQQSVVPPSLATSVVTEQQMLHLQAQVQLLQLPVASLSQQCADLSSRMTGLTEWQQQARTELARLVEAADQNARTKTGTDQLSDAVMIVLDTTARTMAELRQQQDEMVKQIAMLQQQQQHGAAVPLSPLPSSGPPPVPGTPTSASQRVSGAGESAAVPLGGPPSRNLNGQPSLGSVARDSLPQVELRSELESLKSLVADIRKEVATEGGSLRREWQRAFSDMQSRYGEQANELRAREANIAKLREAALVEEAERRATSGYEEKFSARLGKLETNVEYLTHRLEVLEEQVSGVVSTLAGAASPVIPLSPSRMATALAAMRGQAAPAKSAPGPVSENHNSFEQLEAPGRAAAIVAAVSAVPVPPQKQGRHWSAGGPQPVSSLGGTKAQSDGGYLRRNVGAAASTALLPSSPGSATGPGAPGGGCDGGVQKPIRPRHAEGKELGPDEWWRAPDAEVSEQRAAGDALSGNVQRLATGSETYGDALADAGGTDAAIAAPSRPLVNAGASTSGAPAGQCAARGNSATPRSFGGQELAVQHVPNGAAGPSQGHWSAVALSQAQQMGLRIGPGPTVQPMSARSKVPPDWGPQSAQGQGLLEPHMAMPGVTAGVVDPANVALGPQLLTPAAQALLAPSVDIQRLAVAAAAQQEHAQQSRLSAQQRLFMAEQQALRLQFDGQQSFQQASASGVGAAIATCGTAGPGLPATTAGEDRQEVGSQPSRKEPPLCWFCSMQ